MRHVQKGVSLLFLVISVLVVAIASTAGYFVFSKNLKQKAAEINSFEDCAKVYPVMESYPEKCNTPDGKHFTRELTNTEKQQSGSSNPKALNVDGVADHVAPGWNIYRNPSLGIEMQYPPEGYLSTDKNEEAVIHLKYRPKGQFMDLGVQIHSWKTRNPAEIECGNFTTQQNPNGTFVFESKKCQVEIKEIVVDGKKAIVFSDQGEDYIQIETPLIEIIFEGGIKYRSEYGKMVESIKLLK